MTWSELGIAQQLERGNLARHNFALQETYVLHDGPPYANGDLHIGEPLLTTCLIIKHFLLPLTRARLRS